MNNKKQQEHTSERQERFEILLALQVILYPLLGILRRTPRGLEHIPQWVRHHGMDFLVPMYAMSMGRSIGRLFGWTPEQSSTRFGLAALTFITANEISQGLGCQIVQQSRVSDFDYKDLVAAALGFAYYKGLETIARKQ